MTALDLALPVILVCLVLQIIARLVWNRKALWIVTCAFLGLPIIYAIYLETIPINESNDNGLIVAAATVVVWLVFVGGLHLLSAWLVLAWNRDAK